MIGAFLAFVIHKAREELSRTMGQVRDEVLSPAPLMAADSKP